MNLLLLQQTDMRSASLAVIRGRQLQHLQDTLKLAIGDSLTVGLLNESIGRGKISALSATEAEIQIDWLHAPPKALPVTLIIALPRPKMLKRIVQTATTMGVKTIYFINAWKVEKSYWQSPWLSHEKLLENCILGLEQGKDTVLPEIHQVKLFKPFVEDRLATIAKGSRKLLAHPGVEHACPINIQQQTTLIIGPEGGFTPYEVDKLLSIGFEGVHLGERILRVETAVPVLLARLFC